LIAGILLTQHHLTVFDDDATAAKTTEHREERMQLVGLAPEEWLHVEVAERHAAADDIAHFVLRDPSGRDLPAFSAGAHIEIELPNGMRRCYSLCNAPGRDAAYEIAILREPNGRGGSKSAHADLVVLLHGIRTPLWG
jgi:NAD(P)H-flavin reductase